MFVPLGWRPLGLGRASVVRPSRSWLSSLSEEPVEEGCEGESREGRAWVVEVVVGGWAGEAMVGLVVLVD